MYSIEEQFRQSFAAAGTAASRRAAGFEGSAKKEHASSFQFLQHTVRQKVPHSKTSSPGTPLISIRFANGTSAGQSRARYSGLTPGGAATPASAFRFGRTPSAQTPYSTPGRATHRSTVSHRATCAQTSMHPPLDAGWGALPEPRIVSVPSLLDGGGGSGSTSPAVVPVLSTLGGLQSVREHSSSAEGGVSSTEGGSASGRGGSASSSLPSSARSSVATEPRQRPTLRPTVHVNKLHSGATGGTRPGDGREAWGLFSQALVGAGGVHRQQHELVAEGAAAEAMACAAAAGLTRSRALYTPGVWVEPEEPPPAPPLPPSQSAQSDDMDVRSVAESPMPITEADLKQFGGALTLDERQGLAKGGQGGSRHVAEGADQNEQAATFSDAVLDAVFAGIVSSGTLDWGAVFAAVGLGRTDDADVVQATDVEYDSAIPVGTVAVAQGLSPSTLRTWLPRSGVLLTGGDEPLPGGGVALPSVDVLPLGGVGGRSSEVRGALKDASEQTMVVCTPPPSGNKGPSSRIPRLRGSPSKPGGGGAAARQHPAAASSAIARLPSWAPTQPLQALGVSPTKIAEQEHAWKNKYGNAYLGVVRGAQRQPPVTGQGSAAPGVRGARQHASSDSAQSPGTRVVQTAVQSTVADFLSDPRIADMVQGAVRSRLHRAYEHKQAVQRLRGRLTRAQGLGTSVDAADAAHAGALQVLRGEHGGHRAHSPPHRRHRWRAEGRKLQQAHTHGTFQRALTTFN